MKLNQIFNMICEKSWDDEISMSSFHILISYLDPNNRNLEQRQNLKISSIKKYMKFSWNKNMILTYPKYFFIHLILIKIILIIFLQILIKLWQTFSWHDVFKIQQPFPSFDVSSSHMVSSICKKSARINCYCSECF